ncbi:MAG: 30S ribosomal protein S20 [Candidatus Saccharibacteria bacterium]|nr:30S ribosomal protein S20 [Candidatus Saccharibacteria bacterium]
MPIIKSAIKRAKQTIKRTAKNRQTKDALKASSKAFIAKPSQKSLSAAQSELDKAVKKGLIKKNTASRRKANLAKIAKEANVKLK